ncbi:MAG: double-strand break repair helicase AddA, partial [Alphaproteobacteria bacterium]
PDKILCLTFTKAAASEMANRINGRLAIWATLDDARLDQELKALGAPGSDDTRARARRLFAEVLDVPGGLKIMTIHAFCQYLLARFPLEAGVPPHFSVLDERSTAEALDSAVETLLVKAAHDERSRLARTLDRLARRLTENSFAELKGELLRARGRLDRLRRAIRSEDGIGLALRRALNLRPGERDSDVVAEMVAEAAFDGAGLARAASAMMDAGSKRDQERGAVIARWLREPDSRAAMVGEYQGVFLTQAGAVRSTLMTKGAVEACPEGPDILAREAERLQAFIERRKLIEVAENSDAVLAVGFALLDLYRRDKRRKAVLDFDDLILETLELLTAPGVAPWVLYKLDNGIDHILIDEAQDTNPEQWQVVQALAEEFFAGEGARDAMRTIFAVGDVKQSIYSFQRADPREFIASRTHFSRRVEAAAQTFRDMALDLSFRSAPAVLTLVDAVFARDEVRAGLLEDRALRHRAHRHDAAGRIELWEPEKPPVIEEEEGWVLPLKAHRHLDASAKLAVRIADTLAEWFTKGEILPSKGRPVRPGDILVLVRRRGAFDAHLISALKARGIPVAGSDRMVVTEQLAVMDLMAVARFVLLPEDDLTLATVLKGPLLNLGEQKLFTLAHDRGRATLWRALGARRGDDPDFERCHRVLAGWLALADFAPPFEFFTTILNDPDDQGRTGRARLVARLGIEANDPIDEFLNLALMFEHAHTPSLEAFLHWLVVAPAEVKRDMDQGRDQVRVMTVHGAKGLQAPIVFLPDTCQVPSQGPRLLWIDDPMSPDKQILVWPGRRDNEAGPCADARALEKRQQDEEHLRLLYVALTRAEDQLYVCGWDTSRARPERCWYNLVAAAMADLDGTVTVDTPHGPVFRYETPQIGVVTGSDEPVDQHAATDPLPLWARRPPAPEPTPVRPLAPSAPVDPEPAVRSPLMATVRRAEEAVRFRRGNLVHALLERLPELLPDDREAAARRYLGAPAHGLDSDAIDALIRETFAVLDHPDFAPLFAPGSRAEVPVAGLVGTTPVAGYVDRLAVTEERVMVVDYKTNRPPPRSPEQVPLMYLRQMAAYRRLLRDIYPDREVACALLWTDGPRLMELDNKRLDALIL